MKRTWLARRWKSEWRFFSATLAFAYACWSTIWRMWSVSAWTHPIGYDWDGLLLFGAVKAYGDRGLSSLWGAPIHWLGAPAEAVWVDFPAEDVPLLVLGVIGRVLGSVLTINLAFLMAVLLAAATTYLVCRRLRVTPPLAMAAGVLLSLSPYIHYRNIGHLFIAMYWHVPLWFLVWTWASSKRGLRVGTRGFWFSVGVAVLSATLNAYFLNFLMQGLLIIAALQAFRRAWRPAIATGLVMVAGMSVYGLLNLDTYFYTHAHGFNPTAVARSPAETLVYALRPLELFWPWNLHQLDSWAAWGTTYQRTAPVTGEFPSNYLGVVPGLAFVAMVLSGFAGAFWGGRRGTSTRFLVLAAWLTFVSMGGGLMQLTQMVTGFVAFRSNNRVSIVLAAMALVFAARALNALVVKLGKGDALRPWAFVLPVVLFGVWEQSPDQNKRTADVGGQRPTGLNYWQVREVWAKSSDSDEKFVEALEQALPDDAAVLQLPAYPYPEAGPVGGFGDYEPFRLYLHSHHKLRYSYGNMKGRPEASLVQQMTNQPVDALLRTLREKNFGAVVFDRRMVAPNNIDAFRQAAEALGPTRVLTAEHGDWLAVVLPPGR